MSLNSKIEWTEATWNPVTGCDKVSPGCAHCYAERFAERFRDVPGHPFSVGFDLTLRPERLDQPLNWRKPKRIFVNSMSDLFHEDIPGAFVAAVFQTMQEATWHTFQVLTKRPQRARELASALPWPDNVWLGVSVENQRFAERVDVLRDIPAKVRFLSCEPLLGHLTLDLSLIEWVIVGGESGPRARPMQLEWVRSIRDQCLAAGAAFFFKQWGEHDANGWRVGKGAAGRLLDGQMWDDLPTGDPKGRCSHGSSFHLKPPRIDQPSQSCVEPFGRELPATSPVEML
jgi:protein gp37